MALILSVFAPKVESIAELRNKTGNLGSFALNVLSAVCVEELDPSYLILGLGNGQVHVFSEADIDRGLTSQTKVRELSSRITAL